jgi:hypothetical protein
MLQPATSISSEPLPKLFERPSNSAQNKPNQIYADDEGKDLLGNDSSARQEKEISNDHPRPLTNHTEAVDLDTNHRPSVTAKSNQIVNLSVLGGKLEEQSPPAQNSIIPLGSPDLSGEKIGLTPSVQGGSPPDRLVKGDSLSYSKLTTKHEGASTQHSTNPALPKRRNPFDLIKLSKHLDLIKNSSQKSVTGMLPSFKELSVRGNQDSYSQFIAKILKHDPLSRLTHSYLLGDQDQTRSENDDTHALEFAFWLLSKENSESRGIVSTYLADQYKPNVIEIVADFNFRNQIVPLLPEEAFDKIEPGSLSKSLSEKYQQAKAIINVKESSKPESKDDAKKHQAFLIELLKLKREKFNPILESLTNSQFEAILMGLSNRNLALIIKDLPEFLFIKIVESPISKVKEKTEEKVEILFWKIYHHLSHNLNSEDKDVYLKYLDYISQNKKNHKEKLGYQSHKDLKTERLIKPMKGLVDDFYQPGGATPCPLSVWKHVLVQDASSENDCVHFLGTSLAVTYSSGGEEKSAFIIDLNLMKVVKVIERCFLVHLHEGSLIAFCTVIDDKNDNKDKDEDEDEDSESNSRLEMYDEVQIISLPDLVTNGNPKPIDHWSSKGNREDEDYSNLIQNRFSTCMTDKSELMFVYLTYSNDIRAVLSQPEKDQNDGTEKFQDVKVQLKEDFRLEYYYYAYFFKAAEKLGVLDLNNKELKIFNTNLEIGEDNWPIMNLEAIAVYKFDQELTNQYYVLIDPWVSASLEQPLNVFSQGKLYEPLDVLKEEKVIVDTKTDQTTEKIVPKYKVEVVYEAEEGATIHHVSCCHAFIAITITRKNLGRIFTILEKTPNGKPRVIFEGVVNEYDIVDFVGEEGLYLSYTNLNTSQRVIAQFEFLKYKQVSMLYRGFGAKSNAEHSVNCSNSTIKVIGWGSKPDKEIEVENIAQLMNLRLAKRENPGQVTRFSASRLSPTPSVQINSRVKVELGFIDEIQHSGDTIGEIQEKFKELLEYEFILDESVSFALVFVRGFKNKSDSIETVTKLSNGTTDWWLFEIDLYSRMCSKLESSFKGDIFILPSYPGYFLNQDEKGKLELHYAKKSESGLIVDRVDGDSLSKEKLDQNRRSLISQQKFGSIPYFLNKEIPIKDKEIVTKDKEFATKDKEIPNTQIPKKDIKPLFQGHILYEGFLIPVDAKEHEVKWCLLAKTENHIACTDKSALYLITLRTSPSLGLQGSQSAGNNDKAAKETRVKRYPYPDIAVATLHPSGKVAFVVEQKGRLMKLELPTIGEKVSATLLLENILVNDSLFVYPNAKTTHLVIGNNSQSNWTIWDVASSSVAYTSEDISGFQKDEDSLLFEFDENHFMMIAKTGSSSRLALTDINWGNGSPSPFNSIMALYIKSIHDSQTTASKALAASSMSKMLKQVPPLFLLKNKQLFLMLAHLENEEVLKTYFSLVSFKNLFKKSEMDLIAWVFSSRKCGIMVRKLLLDWLNNFEQPSYEDLDTFEPDIFERLIKHKYILKMMQEIYARGIFLKLMRIPIAEKEDVGLQWLVDKEEDVNDKTRYVINYDKQKEIEKSTGHVQSEAVKDTSGNKDSQDFFVKGSVLDTEVKKFKKGLKDIRGNDPVLLQPYISAGPVDTTFGSMHLTELILILQEITDDDLVTNFRPLIYQLWYQAIYPIAILYMVLYWVFAIISYVFYGFYEKNYGLGGASIFFSLLFMASEYLAFKSMGRVNYLQSVWNIVDLNLFIGNIVLVILQWRLDVQTPGWAIGRSLILIGIWLRALTWLRVFKPVRYLITMVLQVFKDMIAYIVVLAGAIIGLTFVWRMSGYFSPAAYQFDEESDENRQVLTFFHALQVVTGMMFGNFPDKEPDDSPFSPFKFFIICLMGLVLALALTNLLIAIINQTYNNIEDKKKVYDLREVMGLILEFNGQWSHLVNTKKLKPDNSYILSLGPKVQKEEKMDNQDVRLADLVLASARRSQ